MQVDNTKEQDKHVKKVQRIVWAYDRLQEQLDKVLGFYETVEKATTQLIAGEENIMDQITNGFKPENIRRVLAEKFLSKLIDHPMKNEAMEFN